MAAGDARSPEADTPLPRVLLVDDDDAIRRLVTLTLEGLPIRLVCCDGVAAARDALRDGPCALLITDLMMPGESGLDLLAALTRDADLHRPERVVVFSAATRPAGASQLQDYPLWGRLVKPVSMSVLEQCVRAAVEGRACPGEPASAPAGAGPATDPQATAARHFGGDLTLYLAFRQSCLPQFGRDVLCGDQALLSGDWPALRRLGHSLASVMTLLDDDEAARQARALELLAASATPDEMQLGQTWARLSLHLQRLVDPAT